MYIWRNKNRRDTRNHLLLGDANWTAATEDRLQEDQDEQIRCENETKHKEYFSKKIRKLMEDYLLTTYGKQELEYVRSTIEDYRKNKEKVLDSEDAILVAKDEMKKNVYDIYKHFMIEQATNQQEINIIGLAKLFDELKYKVTPKKWKSYLNKLELFDNSDVVSFEKFYSGE